MIKLNKVALVLAVALGACAHGDDEAVGETSWAALPPGPQPVPCHDGNPTVAEVADSVIYYQSIDQQRECTGVVVLRGLSGPEDPGPGRPVALVGGHCAAVADQNNPQGLPGRAWARYVTKACDGTELAEEAREVPVLSEQFFPNDYLMLVRLGLPIGPGGLTLAPLGPRAGVADPLIAVTARSQARGLAAEVGCRVETWQKDGSFGSTNCVGDRDAGNGGGLFFAEGPQQGRLSAVLGHEPNEPLGYGRVVRAIEDLAGPGRPLEGELFDGNYDGDLGPTPAEVEDELAASGEAGAICVNCGGPDSPTGDDHGSPVWWLLGYWNWQFGFQTGQTAQQCASDYFCARWQDTWENDDWACPTYRRIMCAPYSGSHIKCHCIEK